MDTPKLWTPPTGVQLMQQSKTVRIVTLRDGSKVRVTTEGNDEDGYVSHREHKDGRVDAMAIPKTVRYKFQKVS